MSNLSFLLFSENTTKKIYYEYVKESLVIFQNIYEEILSFVFKNLHNDENISLDKSTSNIQSWADLLHTNTNSVGDFMGVTSWEMNYTIDPEIWRQDLYIDISRKRFFTSSFFIEFHLDFPKTNHHMISINDRGVVVNHVFFIDENDISEVHTITFTPGIQIAFTNEIINIIRNDISNNSKGTIQIFAPNFFMLENSKIDQINQYFIPLLPFNPKQIYLNRISWIISVLNNIDILIKRTYFFSLSYVTSETKDSDSTNNTSEKNNLVSKYYTPSNIQSSTFMFSPKV
jgi:hypothetical protein